MVKIGSEPGQPSANALLGSVSLSCRVAGATKGSSAYYMFANSVQSTMKGLWYLEDSLLANNINYADTLSDEPRIKPGTPAPTWVSNRLRFTNSQSVKIELKNHLEYNFKEVLRGLTVVL